MSDICCLISARSASGQILLEMLVAMAGNKRALKCADSAKQMATATRHRNGTVIAHYGCQKSSEMTGQSRELELISTPCLLMNSLHVLKVYFLIMTLINSLATGSIMHPFHSFTYTALPLSIPHVGPIIPTLCLSHSTPAQLVG